MISARRQIILEAIIKEHIQTAQPVSSGILVDKYKLSASPATVRNEMMALEEEGYIHQPHTSAGRVPTEKAFRLYLEGLAEKKPKKINSKHEQMIVASLEETDRGLRPTAKALAEISANAVFWAFHKNDLYYTGLSNLFSQAEFKQLDLVCDVSVVIDRMEEIIDGLFESLPLGRQVLIGAENPFGHFLSAILLKYKKNNQTGLVGILSPLRTDYESHLAAMDYLAEKLK
ncbi:MAG TPA: hypothetical protein PKI61_03055 [bacterium]|nr:hypothetical protein [bacterium]HPT29861.1 hypothetical protein [bacterium]